MSDWLDTPGRDECPSAPVLDSYLLGEMPAAEEAVLAAHIGDCPHCTAQLKAMATFGAPEAEARILASVEGLKDGRRTPVDRSRLRLGAAAVAAAVVVALVAPRFFADDPAPPALPTAPDEMPRIRLKGGEQALTFYRLEDGAPQALSLDQPLAPGDRVQAAVQLPAGAHVALFDVMEKSALPLSPTNGAAVRIADRVEKPLEPAFVLESIESGEALWLVVCPQPFDVARVPRLSTGFVAWQAANGCQSVVRHLQPDVGQP